MSGLWKKCTSAAEKADSHAFCSFPKQDSVAKEGFAKAAEAALERGNAAETHAEKHSLTEYSRGSS